MKGKGASITFVSSIIAAVIKDSRKHLKELHITSINVEKALLSTSHYAIVKSLMRKAFQETLYVVF